jgi:acyl-CoA synthetase (AMP-forming)/AMP-acid ligase II/acyl carrier protein
VVGGEAMQIERAREWLGHFGDDIVLWNSYGPAEATSIASVFDVRRLNEPGGAYKQVPVGLPLENSSCHVLGKDGLPVPVGVVGELHIGGTGVAWGYFNRPERTRERFVEWPLPGSDVRRHYRTGDLVRIRDDGQLEFIARVDSQIKIRGFRVETEEVRHVIGTEAGVRQCVVVPREIAGQAVAESSRFLSDKHLVAYVVLQPGTDRSRISQIAANVQRRLPEYMRPSVWVVLEQFPLNVNGKVDLGALPQPEPDTPDVEALEPRTSTEARLQELWQDVLGIGQVSVDADFFALGGHSLLLTRLLLKISEVFEVDLSIAELMRQRTILDMANLIDAVQSVETGRTAAAADLQDELEW